jgi:murein DD-endopeptidase MepM/ murein hydrolase activator NlpD
MWKSLISGLIIVLLGVAIFGFVKKNGVAEAPTTERVASTSQSLTPKEISISVFPEIILQGDPAIVTIDATSTSAIKSLTLNGNALRVFEKDGKPTALMGVDLKGKFGDYLLVLTLNNGEVMKKTFKVGERVIAKAPLGIPEKLGGNTAESEQTLINTLVQEGAIISAVKSENIKYWTELFGFPIAPPITITDVYGYSRETGGSTISHKGTDFRAAVGTPVYAMNRGKVVYTDFLRNYGNTIILDHGFGLLTIYMHLSQVEVKLGETVEKGQEIAKSGDTGYVLGPHLHLTVRINGVSIDPMKFMELLGE